MAVPKNLRVFTLFTDGVNQIGRVTGFTPPKLTRKTEAYRGGGMAGAVNIDLGLDDGALDASFTMGGPTRELLAEVERMTSGNVKHRSAVDPLRLGLKVCAIATLSHLLQHLSHTEHFSTHFGAVSAYRARYGVEQTT